jgi:alkanesulfonate monooxygenase SsuD/methylene tetrahydromethanopterin reductase-like flavin-dependent oxidoreductase (luciferase family)
MGDTVNYAVNVPNFGDYGSPSQLAALASDAENAGWDGFFIWDHISGPTEWRVPVDDTMVPIAHAPYADPCVALTAIATHTEHIRLGALVTPLARRRPWKLARETVSLDHLSNGRLVVGVGLGGTPTEFAGFGEDADPLARSRKLDESLEILTGLWTGKPFSYKGTYYVVEDTVFLPRPVQSPRIPIWVACFWPNKKPLRRAARYDGVVPGVADWTKPLTPDDVESIVSYVLKHRTQSGPFDVVVGGRTPSDADQATSVVQPYIDSGATWWSEELSGWRGSLEDMRARICAGPPRSE